MATRSRRRSHLALLAGAGLALLVAVPCAAATINAPAPLPDDVVAWFEQQAAATITDTHDGLVAVDDSAAPYDVVTIGEPQSLLVWSAPFRRGEQTTSPTEASGEWIAPFEGDGAPAGTITAWREDGEVTFASGDDHTLLAAALGDLAPGTQLVYEPVLGAYFALVGGQVQTLMAGWYEGPDATVPVADFQPALAASVRSMEQAVVDEEAGSRWWVPVTAAVAGLVALVAVAALLTRAWRRTAPH